MRGVEPMFLCHGDVLCWPVGPLSMAGTHLELLLLGVSQHPEQWASLHGEGGRGTLCLPGCAHCHLCRPTWASGAGVRVCLLIRVVQSQIKYTLMSVDFPFSLVH